MKLVLLLATAALAASSSGCSSPVHALEKGPELDTVPVRLSRVDLGPVDRPIRAPGLVVPKDERDLSFKVGGMIARVLVDTGASLRRGQLLAALDATELEAGVQQARVALEKARRDASRASRLAAADSAPVAAAEDTRTAVALAEATLEAAEFNLRHAVIVAPDDGWVDQRLAEPGEVVGPGRPILHVSGSGRGMVVRASLAEGDVLDLEPGASAEVRLDARPGVVLPGKVTEVARSAARGTGTWQIEVAVSTPPDAPPLLSGLTAKLTLPRHVRVEGAVPVSAVVDGDGDEGAVFVVVGGHARRRPVRIAFLAGEKVALTSGLEGVTSVVSDGAARLTDGAAVRVGE